MSLKDTLLNHRTPLKPVHIPNLNVTVYIKKLSLKHRDDWEMLCFRASKKSENQGLVILDNMRSKFLSMVLCDADRQLLFTEAELQELESDVFVKLFEEASAFNSLTEKDLDELKNV